MASKHIKQVIDNTINGHDKILREISLKVKGSKKGTLLLSPDLTFLCSDS